MVQTLYNHISKFNIFKKSQDHLQDVNMTYFEHLKFSFNLALIFTKGIIPAIIHSLIPALYTTSSSDISDKLVELLDHNPSKNN